MATRGSRVWNGYAILSQPLTILGVERRFWAHGWRRLAHAGVWALGLYVALGALGQFAATDTAPRTHTAYVVRVIDGDTIEVEVEGVRAMVRLMGIDTPDVTGDREDQYGRLLRYVTVQGVDVNAALVREGYARAVRGFSYSRRTEFIALEEAARVSGIGLWSPRGVQ